MEKVDLEMTGIGINKRIGFMIVVMMLLLIGGFSQVEASTGYNQLDLIEFSSYLGGSDDESMGVSFAFGDTIVDSKGNIIVVGTSYSDDFPVKNAYQGHLNGARDSIIAKFHPNGSLIFSTYLGGSALEFISGIAVDSEDNIILAGETGSTDYPLVNPYESNCSGLNLFITKISEDGQSLLFSTVFGGTGSDYLYAMGMDSSGRIAITGTTASTDFPLLNPTQSVPAGNLDVYISFFEADGQSLLFSTYLGTSGIDHGRQIGFDSEGNVVIAGMIANGLLATDGAYQEEYGGGSSDAFVAKYTTNGTLEYFTFLGGEDLDTANDMAIDDNDNIVVTGYTISDNFPCLNAIQAEPVDRAEIFITKLTPNGKDLVFSTLLGGSAADYGNAIKVDSQGRILITGQTSSNDFPTTFPLNISESRYYDSLLVMLNQDGSLLFSTLFGGTRDDIGMGVAWHSNDTIVIFGYTDSPDFPVEDAYQGTHSGSNDMFIMKLNLAGMIDVPPAGLPFGVIEGVIIVGVVLIVLISVVFLRKRMGQ